VTVSWEARDRALRLDWEERDGPEAAEPARLGFGSRLIRRTVERELAGRVEIRFEATGLRCTIELPPGDAGLGPDRTAGEAAGLERVRPAA
jgi:two-component sensor histidine kinase